MNEYPTIIASKQEDEHITEIREIHELTPPPPRGRAWETVHHTHRSSSLSVASEGGASSSDNFSMSREFSALVLAGEEDLMEETNPLAIVPDNHPLQDPVPSSTSQGVRGGGGGAREEHVSVQMVKKEEVDAKISAWQNAKVAKINNRFKREDAVINGWESEQVQKASSWMKKVEKLKYFSSLNRSRLA
ncbi:hypothetical protein AAZX31_U037500 [Glycine max]